MIKGPHNIHLFDIMKYRFPLIAVTSILHRISGVLVFLLIPFVLWLLHASLVSPQEFLLIKVFMGSPWMGFLMWLVASATFYHLVAGFKHLLMDLGHVEEKISGRNASIVVLVLAAIGAVLIGVWIIC
jgi:succinate dehydrogenase / fumarate reductase cytochrome b subunit